jgi:prepilin-type processing-associated H-X9-DG protein
VLTFILPYLEEQALYDQIDQKFDWFDTAITSKGVKNSDVTSKDVDAFLCPSTETRPSTYTTDYYAIVDISDTSYCSLVEGTGLAKTKRNVEKLTGMLGDQPSQIRKVSDGLSKTFMFFESAGRPNLYDRAHALVGTMYDAPNTRAKPGQAKVNQSTDYQWADGGTKTDGSDGTYAVLGAGSNANCPLTTVMNCDNYQAPYSFHSGGANVVLGDGSVQLINESIDIDTFISLFTRGADDVPGPY